MPRNHTKPLLITIVNVFSLFLVGCSFHASAFPNDITQTGDSPYPTPSEALSVLSSLPVKGKTTKTDYSRVAQFGKPWTDDNTAPLGHNGCDTRNDILNRDLTDKVNREIHANNHSNYHSSSRHGKYRNRNKNNHHSNYQSRSATSCHVVSGTLHNPYTGKIIHFTQCRYGKVCDVQIDHIVALANAWQTGARNLTQDQRVALANDPRNLIAVDRVSNDKKSDNDASGWLPRNRGFWCVYVEKQIWVKKNYHLWVTAAEKRTMMNVLHHYCAVNN